MVAVNMGVEPASESLQPIKMKRGEKLVDLSPEYHIRKSKDGKYLGYVCEDRVGSTVILSQKLPRLAQFCTRLAGESTDQAVTLASLYAISKVADGSGRTGGWSKHRWRVRPYELGPEAVAVFESLRRQYKEAIVLGPPHCMTTVPCV
jgi:hypothetical protein